MVNLERTQLPQSEPDTRALGNEAPLHSEYLHSQAARSNHHPEHLENEARTYDPKVSLLSPNRRPSMTNRNRDTAEISVDEVSDHSSSHRPLWQPFWLRRSVLSSFALLFTLCWIALVVLWSQTRRDDGLALTLSHNHYAWTYGPTAILVIIVSLWRQVDYTCKSVQPWHELKSSVPATRSLLLDYLSPLQIVSFKTSLRYRHWRIAASIAAFVLLKFITLFSTVLFLPLSTERSKPVAVSLTTIFNGSSIWPAIAPAGLVSSGVTQAKNATVQYPLDETRTYLNLSSSPVYAYLSVLQGESGDPPGTKDGLVFQTFHYNDDTSNIQTITTEVDIFEPLVDCEPAQMSFRYPVNTTMEVQLKIDAPTCHLSYPHSPTLFFSGTVGSSCSLQSFVYSLDRLNCSTPSPITLFDYKNSSVPTDGSVNGDYRIILSSLTLNQANNTKVDPFCGDAVQNASAVVCKIGYSMMRGNLTNTLQDNSFDVQNTVSQQISQLEGLQSLQLTELILSTLFTARSVFGSLTSTQLSAQDALFGLMVTSEGSQNVQKSDLEQFTNAGKMSDAASKVLSGLAVQVVRTHALKVSEHSVTGISIYSEVRLHIRDLSLWIMVAGFILLSVIALIMMILSPEPVIAGNPGSIITSAAILSQSPDVNKLLRKMGQYRDRFLKSQLRHISFRTENGPPFGLVVNLPDNHVPRKGVWQGFWTPIPLRTWMLALILGPPLVLIAVLEILFQTSERDQGLATVLDGSSSASNTLRYGSTLVMLLVATAFNALDFQISVFAPFQKLRSGSTSGCLLSHLLGQTPLFALYESLRNRYYGAFFSNLAGLVGSVLTIIVSGLWVVSNFSHVLAVTGNSATYWDWSWANSVMDDGGAAKTLNSVERGSVGNTTGVWGDLVFPMVANLTINNTSSGGNYSLFLPALRPVLDCTMITSDNIVIYNLTQPGSHQGSNIFTGVVSAYVKLPSGCQGGPDGNQSFTYFNQSLWTVGEPGTYTTAVLHDLHLGPWPVTKANNLNWLRWGESTGNLQQPNNPDGCPSIGVIMGYLNTASTPSHNIAAAVCYQRLQQIQTKVTFIGLPQDNLLDLSIPPLADESSAFYLTNGTEGVTSFPYRIEGHLNNDLPLSDGSEYQSTYNEGGQQFIDPFFDHIINGALDVSFEDMFSNSSKLLESIDRMYRSYMVQVVAAKFRLTASHGQNMAFNGDFMGIVSRLQVNKTSKIILQAMLGAMTFLGLLAIATSKIRAVLPHNPCSIAGIMALFAGSDICEKNFLPDQAAYMTKQEYKRYLDGYLFSLGWWEDTTGTRLWRRFGIDIGKATASAPDESKQSILGGLRRRRAKVQE